MIKIRPNLYEGLGMSISGVRRKAFNELNEQVYSGNIKTLYYLQLLSHTFYPIAHI